MNQQPVDYIRIDLVLNFNQSVLWFPLDVFFFILDFKL